MAEILQSRTYSLLPEDEPYWSQPWELWARSYAQYIAWRSGSVVLQSDLNRVLRHEDPRIRVRYWPYDEFAPIAAAIDRLMEARGWAIATE